MTQLINFADNRLNNNGLRGALSLIRRMCEYNQKGKKSMRTSQFLCRCGKVERFCGKQLEAYDSPIAHAETLNFVSKGAILLNKIIIYRSF